MQVNFSRKPVKSIRQLLVLYRLVLFRHILCKILNELCLKITNEKLEINPSHNLCISLTTLFYKIQASVDQPFPNNDKVVFK